MPGPAEIAGAAYVTSATASVSSASFTPNPFALIVAIGVSGNGNGITQTNLNISDTLGGSANGAWTNLVLIETAGDGSVGVWCKDAGATPTAGVVTVGQLPTTVLDMGLIVRQFTNAAATAHQNGATNTANGTVDQVSVTPNATNSQIVGGFGGPTVGAVTPNAATLMTTPYGQTQGTNGDTFGVFEGRALTGKGSAQVLGWTATHAVTVIAAVEILAVSDSSIAPTAPPSFVQNFPPIGPPPLVQFKFAPPPVGVGVAGPVMNTKNLTANLTFRANLTNSISKGLTGATLSFAGSATKAITKTLPGATLSFAGTMSKLVAKILVAAVLSFAGNALGKAVGKLISAILSFSGGSTLTNAINKGMAATLSFAGTLTKQLQRALTATLSFSGGSLRNAIGKLMAATLSFGTAQTRAITKTLTGATLSFSGTLTKAISKTLTGAVLSFAGALTKTKIHLVNLAATLSFSGGSLQNAIHTGLSAALSFSTSQTRAINKGIAGTLSYGTTLMKQTNKTLTGAVLSFAGSLSTLKTHLLNLTANLSFSTSQTRAMHTGLAATLSFAGTQTKSVAKTLTAATLNISGAIARQTGKVFIAGVSFSTKQSKAIAKTITSKLGLAGRSTFEGLHWLYPGYEYPTNAGGIWLQVAGAAPENPPGYVIASIAGDGGPGTSVDPNWTTAIANAQAAGWIVLGYVNTSTGGGPGTMLPLGGIETEVDFWNSLYGITNIFFDQVTGGTGDLANYQTLARYVRTTHAAGFVAMNVGATPGAGYESPSTADVVVVYENTEALYNVAGYPPRASGTGIAHIITSAVSAASMAVDLTTAMSLGAEYIYVTDQSGYTTPVSFFSTENDAIGGTLGGSLLKAIAKGIASALKFVGALVGFKPGSNVPVVTFTATARATTFTEMARSTTVAGDARPVTFTSTHTGITFEAQARTVTFTPEAPA